MDFKHKFMGVEYRVTDDYRGIPSDRLGQCHKNTLRVPAEGDTFEELYVVCHEAFHALFPWMSEEAVARSSRDFARYMWRLKWRKV